MTALLMTKPMPTEPFERALAQAGFDDPVHTSLQTVDPDQVRWLVAWSLPAGVLPRLRNLELLFCPAAGVDKLLATPDRPDNLPISRVSDEAQSLELSQYVVHAALDHLRLAPLYRKQQAAHDWTRHRAPAVGIPALVLGMGPIGQTIARCLNVMGFEASGWSRTPRDLPGIRTYAGQEGLAEALPKTRLLVCALPLTPQTTGLIDARMFAALPKGAIFVTIGRGGQVVEPDLIAALQSGHLGGATLDVQAREPMPADDPLWSAPNLVITPHVAGQLNPDAVMRQFMAEVARLKAGQPLMRRVDPSLGY
ncbi:MAG: NAD(P)-dependent oxidoreductase [Burkholderiales bacterium]|jgi:glyoxylate/hydroxypyruvate reductase A